MAWRCRRPLRQAGSPLPILFLTGHGDIPTTVQAIRGGAEDFLTKHAPKEHLIAAVNRALARNALDRARAGASAAHARAVPRPSPNANVKSSGSSCRANSTSRLPPNSGFTSAR